MDPAKMKVVDLRTELSSRGLDTKGNKAVLVKRLKEALEKELKEDLPDTTILDTSTEETDTSQVEEVPEKEEPRAKETAAASPENNPPEENVEEPAEQQENEEPEPIEAAQPEDDLKGIEIVEEAPQENGEHDEESEQPGTEKMEEGSEKHEHSKGEKRKRTEHESADKYQKKRSRSPIKEDEPEIDVDKPQLSWYDSDLHLQVDKQSFLSAKPINDGAFGYMWAGARTTHGISSGKICYEVKITEELKWEDLSKQYEYSDRRSGRSKYRTDHRQDRRRDRSRSRSDKNSDKDKEKPSESSEKMDTEEADVDKMVTVDEVTADDKIEEKEEEKPKEEEKEEEKPKEEEKVDEKAEAGEEKKPEPEPIPTHLFRVGFSLQGTSLQLGESKHSFGYESSGKFVTDKEFEDYGVKFGVGDVVGAFLSIDDDEVSIVYSVNGVVQPTAVSLPRSEFPAVNFSIFPHVLSRNFVFEINLGTREEPWFPIPEELKDYKFLSDAEHKVPGLKRPETRNNCEVIMMIGLPASGKTYWVKEHIQSNEDKDYTILGNNVLLQKMTVSGEPLKSRFKGSWKLLNDKLHKCLNRLTDIAAQRRRNFIIDQTNLFPAAQRRKMRSFEGFKRRAVVVVVGEEEQAKRQELQEKQDGKEVPASTVLELKASMEIPDKEDWLDEILYPELSEEEARKMVKKYNEEARAKGYSRRFPRRDNSRSGYHGQNHYGRNFPPRRYDRWAPQGGWNRPGGGWDRRDRRGPPPPLRSGGWRDDRPSHSYSGPNYNRNQGRSGDGWQSGGNWNRNRSGGGGWNQQAFSGYAKWHQNDGSQQGWNYQGNYGGGNRQNWDYYGQYGQQHGWGQQY